MSSGGTQQRSDDREHQCSSFSREASGGGVRLGSRSSHCSPSCCGIRQAGGKGAFLAQQSPLLVVQFLHSLGQGAGYQLLPGGYGRAWKGMGGHDDAQKSMEGFGRALERMGRYEREATQAENKTM